MKTRLKIIAALSLALCATSAVLAQPGAQPAARPAAQPAPASAQQQPAADVQAAMGPIPPQVLLGAAVQVVRALDIDDHHALWANASPAVRAKVTAQDFARGTLRMRQGLGTASGRVWVSMTLQQLQASATTPGGLYANCEFETQFSGGARKREMVSLRLDEDKTWRLAGYTLN